MQFGGPTTMWVAKPTLSEGHWLNQVETEVGTLYVSSLENFSAIGRVTESGS